MYAEFWWGKVRARDRLEEVGVNGRIILKWILKKQYGRRGMERFVSGQGQLYCLGCLNDRTGLVIGLFHQRNFFYRVIFCMHAMRTYESVEA